MARGAREKRVRRRGGEDCLYRILSHKFISHRCIISFSFELALHVIHAACVCVGVLAIVFRTRSNLIFVSFTAGDTGTFRVCLILQLAMDYYLFIYQSNDYEGVFVLDASQFLSVYLSLSLFYADICVSDWCCHVSHI